MPQDTQHPALQPAQKRTYTPIGSLIDGIQAPKAAKHFQNFRPVSLAVTSPLTKRALTTSRQVHKSLQSSRTLMRHAVKKPSTITNKKVIAMDVVDYKPGQATMNAFHTPITERLNRARSVQKLAGISRFGDFTAQSKLTKKPFTLHIPDELTAHSTPAAPYTPLTINRSGEHIRPSTIDTLLDNGLRNASSHENNSPYKNEKRVTKLSKKLRLGRQTSHALLGVFTILVLGGFLVYLNLPRISVRYAAAKAGVSGAMPTYQPAGYAVSNHVSYSPGEIAIVYKANADDRNYVVSQKNTSWNSDALKDHLSTAASGQLQTYPQNGQTIYLHDGAQADWVSNGVWYSIYGTSKLNTDQLIKIANSLK